MVGQLLNFKTENRGEEPDCPHWLKYFLGAKFFVPCSCCTVKTVRNLFCVDCAEAVCSYCSVESHIQVQHHILQIRRSPYHNAVRIHDAQNYLDTTAVQPYVISGSKVVFLSERPQSRVTPLSNPCRTCGRSLRNDSRFCSIACKYECGENSSSLEPREDVCCSRWKSRKPRTPRKHKVQTLHLDCNSMERLPQLTDLDSTKRKRVHATTSPEAVFRKKVRKPIAQEQDSGFLALLADACELVEQDMS